MISDKRIYLDYNATAPVRDQVKRAMARALDDTGNPSSIHAEGRAARAGLERARMQIARLIGANAGDITFTSGGTEAANLAIRGVVNNALVGRVLVSAIEHPCVLAAAEASGLPVEKIAITPDGVIDLAALKQALEADDQLALVCVIYANNETGALQPVAEAVHLVHEHNGLVFTDAVQAAGKLTLDFQGLGADFMSISGHKIGAAMGVGALALRPGLNIAPLVTGGGQELGLRGGTENIAGIVGFGAAAESAYDGLDEFQKIALWRDRLESGLKEISPDHVVFARNAPRLANTSCFAAQNVSAQTALITLDLEGLAVSSGSACSSGKVSASHVLSAMGVDEDLARGAIRVSLGYGSKAEDIDKFIAVWRKVHEQSSRHVAA